MSAQETSTLQRFFACCKAMRAHPDRSMKLTSIVAGSLLLAGGISGLLNIFNPLGAVLSFYNIIFAALILVSELKHMPIIKTLNKRVDKYFHLLSVPRGKASFYVFVGVLAFFASPISISSICILLVTIVGVLLPPAHRRPLAPARDPDAGADAAVPPVSRSFS
jgi:hypothetical protein